MIPRTVFEAAVIYAQALMDRHQGKGLAIIIVVQRQGLMLKARLGTDVDAPRRDRIVSWHDIEHAQYDALRSGLDKLVEDI